MMLVMVAYIQCYDIYWPVIAGGFLCNIVGIMLLYPTGTNRVQTNREEEREHEVKQTTPAAKHNNSYVEGHRKKQVYKGPLTPHTESLNTRRTGNLEHREKQ